MPRGIPNAKRDDMGMRFTTFNVPLLPNPKQMGANYLRSEQQTLWYRNSRSRARPSAAMQDLISPQEGRRGSKVIVIHPGSRWLRIGRASDVSPVSVPHVIARKHKPPVPPPAAVQNIARPRKGKGPAPPPGSAQGGDEYTVVVPSDDPVEGKIAAIARSLRDRMRFYKLRVTVNAAQIASQFNERFKAETMTELTDVARVKWIQETPKDDRPLIGEDAFRLSDPQKLGYTVKRPIHGGNLNTRDYSSIQHILADLETIWTTILQDGLAIDPKSFNEYSVVLVIPDLWDRAYVQAIVNLLLVGMGFKQVCAQQESLAATYGAGISNACVIDMGAVKTSIACVDDGLVLPDTRMSLNVGGDDITEFLYVLLERISFPYKEIDLTRSYDWALMEDLKVRLCTLTESAVALNLYDFVIRRPGKPFLKYGLRAYDEVILAPMCLFEPRVVEFEQKRAKLVPPSHPDVSDEVIEYITDRLTNAMLISTQHLMPQAQPQYTPSPVPSPQPLPVAPEAKDATPTPALPQGEATFAVQPQPAEGTPSSQMSNFTGSKTTKFIAVDASKFESLEGEPNATASAEEGTGDKEEKKDENEKGKGKVEGKASEGDGENSGAAVTAKADMAPDTEMKEATEVKGGQSDSTVTKGGDGNTADSQAQDRAEPVLMDVDVKQEMEPKQAATPVEASRPPSPPQQPQENAESTTAQQAIPQAQQQASNVANGNGHTHPVSTPYLGNMPIDVVFEASKLPLDVAIFNSARAAGGDDRIRKYLQAVLVVGGTAHIPGMAHALESRLQAIATPLVSNMEKVQIIPPPKDVDPRLLVWKGAAVLGKMDGVSDLWVTASDWELLGMRGLKERCYFL